ncbi:hypothetical protein DES53_103394 [Roseimicrobium gellanilyticum]|uniref:Uncharacterized protein n=1 Tax=Roseimicrobium gellanilyticum TaxID=748857 RepID=A0A366HPH4_9BACT|nr:phage holin family protein [Roseimicrobium gellanilyticum]RBP45395.1 hypothetical protein DES53_103394 [Roseimicrobium gellanilyticum]
MGSNSSLSELLQSLDATTYFFVTSGLFISIVGLVFFILGLWFGGLLWRGYKRRYRVAEATIESLKNEAAQLKRRIAGQSPRTQGNASTLELSEPDLPPAEEPGETSAPPASRAFTIWTEPATPKVVCIAEVLSNTPAESPAPEDTGFTAPLLFPTPPERELDVPPLVFPPSQAFSLWTEEGWEPTPAPTAPQLFPPSSAFTLWTTDDFQPAHVRLAWPPSAAFTLWTCTDFVPPLTLPLPEPESEPAPAALSALPPSRDALIAATATAVRSVASYPRPAERRVIVTFPDERPASPRGQAFTLWTQSSGTPTPDGSGISQRSALTSLIRSRVEAPPHPPLPPLDMEPLPFVPAAETDA